MWKVKTGEWAPLWWTLPVFTQADGKLFIPPIIVHQANDYSKDIHFNIPLDWTVHHTTHVYMDRYGCLKATTQLSNVCSTSPVNNQIILFDGNDSHFDKCTLRKMKYRNIQTFLLKAGKPTNEQADDNGPNSKLNSLYNVEKDACVLNYGTTKFLPHQTNSVLVEAWDAFNVSAGNTTRDSFAEKKLPPPPHPSRLNNKYPGIGWLHPSMFWSQGWRNQQYITEKSCTYWGTSNKYW